MTSQEQACESILESYVSHLVNERQVPLVAFYVAKLQSSTQVQSYAAFLEGYDTQAFSSYCYRICDALEILSCNPSACM